MCFVCCYEWCGTRYQNWNFFFQRSLTWTQPLDESHHLEHTLAALFASKLQRILNKNVQLLVFTLHQNIWVSNEKWEFVFRVSQIKRFEIGDSVTRGLILWRMLCCENMHAFFFWILENPFITCISCWRLWLSIIINSCFYPNNNAMC